MLVLLLLSAFSPQDLPRKVDLATLKGGHPRLSLTRERLQALQARHKRDADLQRMVGQVLAEADSCLKKPDLEYKIPDGLRLLRVSRDALHRISTLSFAWRWTKKKAYFDRALADIKTVCAFPDWNAGKHFLDTAEMTHAVALGYDWLFSDLKLLDRNLLRERLVELGLKPGLSAYRGEGPAWFPRANNNWNQVCNFGMIIGALAVADTDRDLAVEIMESAFKSLPLAMRHYAPDGAWMEGPGYWNYATRYCCFGISALDTAMGNDFGCSAFTGFDRTGEFPIATLGPSGSYLGFADTGMRPRRRGLPSLLFLANKFARPDFAADEHRVLKSEKANVFHVIWYRPSSEEGADREKDRFFGGPVEVALMRSSWKDPDALWVGLKAGYNQVPHGHLDLGNFELDAMGRRWAVDLGKDDYNLPGYWEGRKDEARRWSYYRLNSMSHNVCTLDGKSQRADGTAEFIRFHTNRHSGYAVVDLKNAYREVTRAMRGVNLDRESDTLLLQDEFEWTGERDLQWGMTTDARIGLRGRDRAMLNLQGRALLAKILEPKGARFEVETAEQEEPQEKNGGFSRLLVRLPKKRGGARIVIHFIPMKGDVSGEGPPPPTIVPLENWPGPLAPGKKK